MGMNVTTYARHRGVSHVAVLKAIKAGRIIKETDGTIDPVKADAAWEQNTSQAQQRKTTQKEASDARPADASPTHSSIVGDGDVNAEVEAANARAEGKSEQASPAVGCIDASGGRYSHVIQLKTSILRLYRRRRIHYLRWYQRRRDALL